MRKIETRLEEDKKAFINSSLKIVNEGRPGKAMPDQASRTVEAGANHEILSPFACRPDGILNILNLINMRNAVSCMQVMSVGGRKIGCS